MATLTAKGVFLVGRISAITVVGLLVLALFGSGWNASSDTIKQALSGSAEPLTVMVGNKYRVTSPVIPVIANKYGALTRAALVKDFLVNPGKAAKSKLLYLYDINHIPPEKLALLFKAVVGQSAGDTVIFTGKKMKGESLPDTYFGTPFAMQAVSSVKEPHTAQYMKVLAKDFRRAAISRLYPLSVSM